VRFWDSSALVALHVRQEATDAVRRLYADDPSVLAWTMSDVEIRSALCRLGSDGAMRPDEVQEAITRIEAFWDSVHVVSVVEAVKGRAKRLLDRHALSAADALQLGAALTAAYDEPLAWEFVCLDEQLGAAARRERFTVLP
jgi:predicted nucleic acid-binding protein